MWTEDLDGTPFHILDHYPNKGYKGECKRDGFVVDFPYSKSAVNYSNRHGDGILQSSCPHGEYVPSACQFLLWILCVAAAGFPHGLGGS